MDYLPGQYISNSSMSITPHFRLDNIRYTGGSWVNEEVLVRICDDGGDRYRFGFNGQEKVNEISGMGNHNTAEFWEYDTRLGRRWNVDPVDQISVSNYAVFRNNPIVFTDVNGEEPREGNQVLNIDFDFSFITLLKSGKPRFKSTDISLNKKVSDRMAHITLIGPRMRGPVFQQKFFEFKDYYDIVKGTVFSQTNRTYSWIIASKSKEGYNYVEFKSIQKDRLLNIRREVRNLNKELEIEKGFENIVTRKQTVLTDKKGNSEIIKEEFWFFRNNQGVIEFDHMEIDMKPGGKVIRSGWIKAKPNLYKPIKNK